ncbi:penicillin acylase family protein [Georgenia halophila]|uniref:Penicillin acylase family protein n=1 Tax=Georgenia halophila TaxID=620889 RepID=A0ABP8L390_9MICO
MHGSSALRKALIIIPALVVALVVAGLAVGVAVVRRPLPDHGGTQTVEALGAAVEIYRDERGVPQIYADTDEDLMRAQGYVHAQDRFFEMDYRRHVTAGRLSELVGENEAALNADLVVRTLGWRRVAEQEWELLSDEARSLYEAYAEGVNSYIGSREASELGLEYTVLGTTTELRPVEPWEPVDSLAWLKAMAWDLRGNYAAELGRASALRTLGEVGRAEELYPSYPYDEHAPILPEQENGQGDSSPVAGEPPDPAAAEEAEIVEALGGAPAADALAAAEAALSAVPTMMGEGEAVGSNSFVVAGEHTASGSPLLANDPHLALEAPGLWYQVGLHCTERTEDCTFDVAGFSFSGMPGIVIGHNDQLSWGFTNLGADVTDFALERTYDDGTYLRDGARVPLDIRQETIEVDGADPVSIQVRSTENGPIVSDVLPQTSVAASVPVPDGSPPAGFSSYSVSLQWTALTPGRTGEAVFALNRAENADDVATAAELFEAPSQNIVFATVDGDIGYQAPGRIPVRNSVPDSPVPSDGSWPRPGWDSSYDWQGWVPAEQMPARLNPAEGFIVAANQAVTPSGGRPFLTSDWNAGYRSQRIRELIEYDIEQGEEIDVDRANEIMLDNRSPFGPAIIPALVSVPVENGFVNEAVDLLRVWSAEGFPTHTSSAGAVYFNAVWTNLLELTFADDLPTGQSADGGARWLLVVERLLEDQQNPWWDDRTTVNVVEGRDEILRQALVTARQELTNTMGKDPASWEWGKLHQYAPTHPVLGGDTLPAPVQWMFNPTPVEVPGGTSVVNATSFSTSAVDELGRPDFTVTTGPSMRMVVDMADLDASTWVTSTGTSGHPGSTHYTDQIDAWATGETFPWPFSREAVEESAAVELTLEAGE